MTPTLAEIIIFGFDYAPQGFALCNGQVLPINQNQALFALVGTYYGGNGTTTFALPNLQGCTPMHQGSTYVIGNTVGSLNTTLTAANIPLHSHSFSVSKNMPVNAAPGNEPSLAQGPPQGSGPNFRPAGLYNATVPPATSTFAPAALTASTGGSSAFSIEQPYLTMNFCIALTGIFPSQN
jgi:microcystin-dependent protein